MEIQARKDPLVQLVSQVRLACKEPREGMEDQVPLVLKGHKEIKEILGLMVYLVLLGTMVNMETVDNPGQKERKVNLETKEVLDQEDLLELRVQREILELLVSLDPLVNKDHTE